MTTRSGSTQEEVRRRNLGTLVRHVHVAGPTSRSRLTAAMGLNRSTIGAMVADLADAGLVREEAGLPLPARVSGRPSHVVVPEADRVFVLAVDLGVRHLVVARVGLGGQVLGRRARSHERGSRRLATVARTVARLAEELLDEAPAPGTCLGVGAAVPGAVSRPDGRVRFAPNLGWVDAPLGDVLAERLDLPVRVGNDANLGVLAEHLRGAGVGSDHVVFLSGQVGLGGGIVAGGRPLEGFGGYAGELGHLVVNPAGASCRCGARGCWETEVGEDALLVLAGRAAGGGVAAVDEVVAAAEAGEERARQAVERVAEWVGAGLVSVVNLFNPEVVVLGGLLGRVHAAAEETVLRRLHGAAMRAPLEQVRLARPALGADAVLLGAAELAFEPLLRDPLDTLARRSAWRPGRAYLDCSG